MLLIVCALNCEAVPLITLFRLKPYPHPTPFPLYHQGGTFLIISGVGKILAAAATSYLYALTKAQSNQVWLNIGIAGHPSWEIGTGCLAHQVIDQGTKRRYYPSFVTKFPCPTAPLLTVERPEIDYAQETLYDMEAAGFYPIASRFSITELIHCYKIVSDNKHSSAKELNPTIVQQLIQTQCHEIQQLTTTLKELGQKLDSLECTEESLALFLCRWHFTTTQIFQLKRLLQRCQAFHLDETFIWDEKLPLLNKSKEVLNYLEKKINALPLNF